ncbi:hypothetical protein [Burkholderia thailandensis]|uniref:hypothetical protein n=1 Tax=Burkholderia thailandensis TaxID=57975 RepID=UPI002D79DA99|nr:hypothetical protein [Burkholderia thailandensis]WRS69866.1 hypothetical protein U9S59_29930 [Burkholderia thailandensis]
MIDTFIYACFGTLNISSFILLGRAYTQPAGKRNFRGSAQLLNVAQAQVETVMPAYRAAADRCRQTETVTGRLDFLHANFLLLAQFAIAVTFVVNYMFLPDRSSTLVNYRRDRFGVGRSGHRVCINRFLTKNRRMACKCVSNIPATRARLKKCVK